jgi:hypothetical protein
VIELSRGKPDSLLADPGRRSAESLVERCSAYEETLIAGRSRFEQTPELSLGVKRRRAYLVVVVLAIVDERTTIKN